MYNIENYARAAGKTEGNRLTKNIERSLERDRDNGILEGYIYYGSQTVVAIQRLHNHHPAYGVAMMAIIKREAKKAMSEAWDHPLEPYIQKRGEVYRYAMHQYADYHNHNHDERLKKGGHPSGCAYCRHVYSTTTNQ